MFKLTHDELKHMQKVCYKTKKPLFVWGTTGIGKSRGLKDLCKELGKEPWFIDGPLKKTGKVNYEISNDRSGKDGGKHGPSPRR